MRERPEPRGGKFPSSLCWRDRSTNTRQAAKEVAAAWVRRAEQRSTKAEAVAAWSEGGLDWLWLFASLRKKLDASLPHPPRLRSPGPPIDIIWCLIVLDAFVHSSFARPAGLPEQWSRRILEWNLRGPTETLATSRTWKTGV